MTHEQLHTRASTSTRPAPAPAPPVSTISTPVALPVMRTTAGLGRDPGGGTVACGPLDRLRRLPDDGAGPVIRRAGKKGGGTATKPPTDAQIAEGKKPQPGTAYTLAQARAQLLAFDHNQSGIPFRKQIAKAWGDYILATHASTLKAGKVRDTYKSSHDKHHADEFSVSQEIDGIPEIVIHAHMDKDGKPKPGNGVHWKWADGEMVAETYEMSATHVAALLEATTAKTAWDTTGKAKYLATLTLPTTGTPTTGSTTPVATTTTPPVASSSTATVSLPTVPAKTP